MKYMCLVYGAEAALHALSKEGMADLDRRSLGYDRILQQNGQYVMAEALQPVRTSKSVRRRQGKVTVTDGPFAETKEQLLGFIIVEASDLDEALRIAGGIPLAELGTVEVRGFYDVPEG